MLDDLDLSFDVGGIEIEDINLNDFDLQIGYDERKHGNHLWIRHFSV